MLSNILVFSGCFFLQFCTSVGSASLCMRSHSSRKTRTLPISISRKSGSYLLRRQHAFPPNFRFSEKCCSGAFWFSENCENAYTNSRTQQRYKTEGKNSLKIQGYYSTSLPRGRRQFLLAVWRFLYWKIIFVSGATLLGNV